MTSTTRSPEPFVSIVTPVYNGADYLRECIESVLRQSHANFEYTIVDNASTDSTPDIASSYSRRDSRIRHLRFEELVEANSNHNLAFESISPESAFCKVVQADDWLYPECVERMVAVGSRDNVGIVSAFRIWDRIVDLDGLAPGRSVFPGREILREALLGRLHVTGAPTSVLYRADLVRSRVPFYQPDLEHADTDAAYDLLQESDFGFVHQVLTFARRQAGSRMRWSARMNTYGPANIRFLLRYGAGTLPPDEYRRRMRDVLRQYIRFHVRQLPKPSRLADSRFFDLHQTEIAAIMAEGGAADREIRVALTVIRVLLARGAWHPEPARLIR